MEKIGFFEEGVNVRCIKRINTRESLNRIIAELGRTCGEISYIFCTDEYLHKLNAQYLHHDTYTDILTFDYSDKKMVSGDIFISMDRVKENAKLFHVKQENELIRVIVHGVLHLAGYEDLSPSQAKGTGRTGTFEFWAYSGTWH